MAEAGGTPALPAKEKGAEIDNFWDLAYGNGDYLEHWESPWTPPELVAVVAAELIPAGATVLDLGCGAGAEAIFLARSGFRAIGVDSSARATEIARERAAAAGVEASFHRADATDLPFADGSIGFAADRGCFHVVGRDRRSAYAREVHRVLSPGAALLLRGARASSDEEGVIAVDEAEVDRWFVGCGFSRGPVVPVTLVYESGPVEGNLVLLRRSG